jgi:hypothetical protein
MSEAPGGSDGDEVDLDPGGRGQCAQVAGIGSEDVIPVRGQAHHGGIDCVGLPLRASSIPALLSAPR